MMGLWLGLLLVTAGGVIGGAINALMTDNGFALPKYETQNGIRIFRPGFAGNMLIGGVAAAVSWGLYGPASGQALIVDRPSGSVPAAPEGGSKADAPAPQTVLTLASLVGAVMVGVGGARWLSNESDKNLLRAAASEAARGNQNEQLATKLAMAPPFEAYQAAHAAKNPSST